MQRNGDKIDEVMKDVDVSEQLKDQDIGDVEEVRDNPLSKVDRPEAELESRLNLLGSIEKDVEKKADKAAEANENLQELLDDEEFIEHIRVFDDGYALRVLQNHAERYPEVLWTTLIHGAVGKETVRQSVGVIDDQQRARNERYIIDNMDKQTEMFTERIDSIGETVLSQIRSQMEAYRESMKQTYDTSRENRKAAEALAEAAESLPGYGGPENGSGMGGGGGGEVSGGDKIERLLLESDMSQSDIADVVGVTRQRVSQVKKERDISRDGG